MENNRKSAGSAYQAILFDLDGVICHTDRFHYQAWKAIADRLGVYFDEGINNRLRGVSRMESLEIVLEKAERSFSREEKEALAAEKNSIYRKLLATMTAADLAPSVKETLDALRGRGLKLAIGSSSKNAAYILERIGLSGFFDAVSDGNHITRSKPDPEVFLLAAEALSVPPTDCLVVEDAEAGVAAAHNGGMDSAGISDAAHCHLATYSLREFSDLLTIINPAGPKQTGIET